MAESNTDRVKINVIDNGDNEDCSGGCEDQDNYDQFDWGEDKASTKFRVVCQGGVGYGTSRQIDIPISATQFYILYIVRRH